MDYRDFGRAGIRISELVFGGGAVGGLLIDRDEETGREALRRALAAGINWFDTAPSYGRGRSEQALGRLLPEVAAADGAGDAPHVSTKFRIDTRALGDVRGQIERSIAGSLERLHREQVTLLQLHNPIGAETRGPMIGADELLKDGGVLDALEQLRSQRLFTHFGITSLGETPSILRVIESGRIASAQVYFNLLNPSAARPLPAAWPVYDFNPILAACERHGVAAMNIRVFSAGVIASDTRTGREQPLTAGDTVESEASKARAIFAAIGDRYGTRAQTGIRFALAEPRLACVVFGLAELDHLEQAIAAQRLGPLPGAAMAELERVYEAGP